MALAELPYRVRHQLIVDGRRLRSRFRIWQQDEPEPGDWLCDESNSVVPNHLPSFSAASFALFMHTGVGTEWSDIRVEALVPTPE